MKWITHPKSFLAALTGILIGNAVVWGQTNPVTYTYKTVNDCSIQADIYRSSNDSKLTPTLVYIHGGALIYGSRTQMNPSQLKLYLDAGLTVISIDYRLAPETKLPDIISDLKDAFRWIHDRGPELMGIDPDRLGVVGHSAGGYLTLMSGFCVQPRPKVLIVFYGYGDIVGDWYSKPDPYYCRQPRVPEENSGRHVAGAMVSHRDSRGTELDKFYLFCRQNGLWPLEVSGRDPGKDPDFFIPFCPIRNVSKEFPPTLLLHGDQDTDVPYQQSVQMAEELARHKVDSRLITIPNGGHGFDWKMDDPLVKESFMKALEFLKQHINK